MSDDEKVKEHDDNEREDVRTWFLVSDQPAMQGTTPGICDKNAHMFSYFVMENIRLGRTELDVIINSDGGELEAGWAMIDMIHYAQSQGLRVTGRVVGRAVSMAGVVLLACDYREMGPYSEIGIHGYQAMSAGDGPEMQAHQKWFSTQDKKVRSLFRVRTHLTDKDMSKMMRNKIVTYLSATEALEKGVVDAIVDPVRTKLTLVEGVAA